ncbi:hypothetical protein [Vibrio parahaemolyticus]|uniref:hypothetical protein n=1 Tax=Vibrio parahaemolyticus TaxID=670 RepID=UPI00178571FD|nr:hypothetical protein [Vibrio parahaemolyticus]MBD6946496.1 hypothetical protein [Vibrio parahaemolyticus]MBD6960086.1 hypothetical protein [Vibrio parahaemolyticus]MBD6979241.1 hypothetical protein [Vibrio parahaemolyticus]MBD6992292.1 hypothetical protein [Vibrio parahaemolyticus]
MNLESFNRVTQIELHGLDMYDFMRVNNVLIAAVGGVRVFGGSESRRMKFEWNHFDMAEHLYKPSVSEVLAEQLALIPESSPLYLELIEHIIVDWQVVDKTVDDIDAESCAQVIETLAKKRDEIRENLREQPYLNASIDVAQGRFSESVAEWESSAKAPQKCSERAQ